MEVKNITNGSAQEQKDTGIVNGIVSDAVSAPSAGERDREQLLKMLETTRIRTDTVVPPEVHILEVEGKGFFACRDIHAIKAKQKAGKTTALKVMTAALLTGSMFRLKSLLQEPRILYFDTEQSRTDTKLILEDVMQMTGLGAETVDSRIVLHSLRCCECDMLLRLLQTAIESEKPEVVIIDGVVEFVASFNDEAQAKQLIHDLLVLCEEHNCAIINVLHTNKADEDHNMRGHLGTMLAQKAGTVLECRKNNGIITVSCSDSRHAEMPSWNIMFSDEGHILDADEQHRRMEQQRRAEIQQRRREASAEKQKERLDYAIKAIDDHGGYISRKQLMAILMSKFELERSTVSKFIASQVKAEALYEADNNIYSSQNMPLPF